MDEHLTFWMDPATWVSLAVTLFFALIVWKKIPAVLAKILDERSCQIEEQLENAKSLREEAASLLAKYEKDQQAAEKEASELMDNAKAEVKLMISENKLQMEEITKRRGEVAEQKIVQAEAAALKEISALTVNLATSAARQIISANMKNSDHKELIKSSTAKLDSKLH